MPGFGDKREFRHLRLPRPGPGARPVGEMHPALDRARRLVALAAAPGLSFTVDADSGRLMLMASEGSAEHRREGWALPDDVGFDEAREVTLRAVLDLRGEDGRAGYRYRGEAAPGK